MRVESDDVIGVPAERVARILAVSVHQLAGWDRNGLVAPRDRAKGSQRVLRLYRLDELVELGIVRSLVVEHNVAPAKVRRLVEMYRQLTPYPLREFRWGIDDLGNVYVRDQDGGWMGDRRPAQLILQDVIDISELRSELRRKVLNREEGSVGRIEQRRRVRHGKPIFAGTGIPVSAVHTYLELGYDDASIIQAYPALTTDDIAAARAAMTG